MNRVLKRPMFRIGGSTGTGITSGLDKPRKQYEKGDIVTQGDQQDRTQKFSPNIEQALERSKTKGKELALSALYLLDQLDG